MQSLQAKVTGQRSPVSLKKDPDLASLLHPGIGWEQPRVGGRGRNGLWAKVVVGTEGQKLGCESVMLL